jgi:hypothetical protein
MSRKLKRPNGIIWEEFKAYTSHHFNNKKLVYHISTSEDGDYTGRFYFQFDNGKLTPYYTKKTAPKWLLTLYYEAIESR